MDSTLLGGFCSKRRIFCAPALLLRQVLFVPKTRVALRESVLRTAKCIFAHGVSADVSWVVIFGLLLAGSFGKGEGRATQVKRRTQQLWKTSGKGGCPKLHLWSSQWTTESGAKLCG